MNAMRLHELPLLGSNQDSPDPESYETGGSAGEIAANAGRTAPEAGNLPHEKPHGFQHSPSPVRIPGDATGIHVAKRQKCPRCQGRTYEILMFDNLRMPCHVCGASGWVPVPAGTDAGERGA